MRWSVELVGNQEFLRWLPTLLDGGPHRLEREADRFLLISESFESCQDAAAVHSLATQLITSLRGAALMTGMSLTEVGISSIREPLPNGGRAISMSVSNFLSCSAQVVANGGGNGATSVDKALFQKAMHLSTVDSPIYSIMEFMADSDSWDNLYKIYELLKSSFGGANNMAKVVSSTEINRFTHTVNSPDILGRKARHAVQKGTKPPPNPMHHAEAKEFIRRAFVELVNAKLVKRST